MGSSSFSAAGRTGAVLEGAQMGKAASQGTGSCCLLLCLSEISLDHFMWWTLWTVSGTALSEARGSICGAFCIQRYTCIFIFSLFLLINMPGTPRCPCPGTKQRASSTLCLSFFLLVSSAHNKDLSRGRTPRAACPQYFLCDQVIALGRRKRGMTKPSSRKTRPNSRREEPFYPRTIGEGQKRSCYWTVIYSFLSFAQGSLQFYHPSLQCFSQSVLILCAFLPTPITSHTPT